MNLLNDIKDILKDDTEHHLKIEIDALGVTVYLDYDPCCDYKEDVILPIYYNAVDEFCYIPHNKYCEMYKPCAYGLEFTEIRLVEKIMSYLDSHKKEINKLCDGYDIEDRKEKHDDEVAE